MGFPSASKYSLNIFPVRVIFSATSNELYSLHLGQRFAPCSVSTFMDKFMIFHGVILKSLWSKCNFCNMASPMRLAFTLQLAVQWTRGPGHRAW